MTPIQSKNAASTYSSNSEGHAPSLPADHPLRSQLNDEIHARPPEPIAAPCRVSYLALWSDDAASENDIEPIVDLAQRFGATPPQPGANHYVADLGPFRVKWERHTEFSRYTFFVSGNGEDIFSEPAIKIVPTDWLSALMGQVIVAAHVAVVGSEIQLPEYDTLSREYFNGNVLVGASIAGNQGRALTDFRVSTDGFSRFIVQNRDMTERQLGRNVQRLLEMDTYRIMALLALPVARDLNPFLTSSEKEIASIITNMATISEDQEPALLDQLTLLQAAIESRHAETHFRFSAAAAYYRLVKHRIEEIREHRIEGLPTFEEFTGRRLAPAMNTCDSTVQRQDALSERVARATQLLSTRVEMGSRAQNQAVLNSLNRRAKLQLRLQETVEGLSIAAITYYGVGLVGYAVKGLKASGVEIDTDLATGISVPVVVILAAWSVRKIRRMVAQRED